MTQQIRIKVGWGTLLLILFCGVLALAAGTGVVFLIFAAARWLLVH